MSTANGGDENPLLVPALFLDDVGYELVDVSIHHARFLAFATLVRAVDYEDESLQDCAFALLELLQDMRSFIPAIRPRSYTEEDHDQ